MRQELYDYDIFPKVFLTGEARTFTVQSLGLHTSFDPVTEYRLEVLEVEISDEYRFAGGNNKTTVTTLPEKDGTLRVTVPLRREGLYFVDLYETVENRRLCQLRLYALNHDLAGLYPQRGDLHMHTVRSDGREGPAVVAANYRRAGYDFTVISDHGRYFPSLEARKALGIQDDKSDLTDFLVVPGEEVHLPLNDVHYVNFGGSFSVNALVTPNVNEQKAGSDPAWRSVDGNCPEPITREAYEAMIRERAKDVPLELESERLSFASAEWIYDMTRRAGGLGIFPHPYWLCETMQLSQSYLDFFYARQPFDAFEVLGGERYYEHNGFQTAYYYEKKAEGHDVPIVGSTDSHGSTEHNKGAFICSTVILTPELTTRALISAVKAKRSVAVDTISAEFRLVGELRLIKYVSFLMQDWYPLHDELCRAEGVYLKAYVNGDENAHGVLRAMKGQIPRLFKRYFAVEEDV